MTGARGGGSEAQRTPLARERRRGEAALGPTGAAGKDGRVRSGRREAEQEEAGEEEAAAAGRQRPRGEGASPGGEGGVPAFHVARSTRLLQLSERGSGRRARRGEAEGEGRKRREVIAVGAERERPCPGGPGPPPSRRAASRCSSPRPSAA